MSAHQLLTPTRCPTCHSLVEQHAVLVDSGRGLICYGGREVYLTKLEMTIFAALLRSHPNTHSKDRLFDLLYSERYANGDVPASPKIIDVAINHLRKKVTALGILISTSWGRGYGLVFGDPESAQALLKSELTKRRDGRSHWLNQGELTRIAEYDRRGLGLIEIAARMRLPYSTVHRALARTSEAA